MGLWGPAPVMTEGRSLGNTFQLVLLKTRESVNPSAGQLGGAPLWAGWLRAGPGPPHPLTALGYDDDGDNDKWYYYTLLTEYLLFANRWT